MKSCLKKQPMKKTSVIVFRLVLMVFATNVNGQQRTQMKIDLSGEWRFQVDSLDKGLQEQWFTKNLKDKIKLPGSMTTNRKGNDIDINTPWTGSIVDSSWFTQPQYAKYRVPGNIKVPFWLQPVKYYKGAAWYQKKFTIPVSWKGKHIDLFLERCHWETVVWLDGKEIGLQNSLATPHVFDITKYASAGEHQLTICVDNRVKSINVGENSHSISDHTQTNWNGLIGKLYVTAYSPVYINQVDLFPDIENKQVKVRIQIMNTGGQSIHAQIELNAVSQNAKAEKIKPLSQKLQIDGDSTSVEIIYPMGSRPLLWDEFNPNLYTMFARLSQDGKNINTSHSTFGMRRFSASGTQFTINGRLTFLRGTLECAIFPKTGYPPTDTASWMRIFKICRSYGLNHIRFHSWCPPEAAFDAADRSGFYLQVECDSWANQGAVIGDGEPLDQFIYDESERIVKTYGNHPSFCMMVYGNEPAGKNLVKYLTEFVQFWKAKDSRRLYTSGSGWPVISESDYNSSPDPRIQLWGQGLKSIINSQPPSSDYDWKDIINKWQHPTVSHEIGQWCVYPDFKEIVKYTGVLKAKNFEIFQQTLADNGMKYLADSFLLASGKLQALCYKADIEAALRTPGFGGFQLLDLHDFPGQGTALVGVLNPFWEDKGYITGKEYSRFCNAVVPLARLKKLVYQNNEPLTAQIQVANFGANELDENIAWNIKNTAGEVLYKGQFKKIKIPLGNSFIAGEINQPLSSVKAPGRFILTVSVGVHENSWDFFVYPARLKDEQNNILVTQRLDANALDVLNNGGKVLLTIKQGTIKADKGGDIQVGFSSIFWNTAWTGGQPPVTLGILCDPNHPAFKEFPTQYHSNFQWQDAMSHCNVIRLDSIAPGIQPILRVIDDWVTARPLGLLFECKIGKGKLLVSGIDLISNNDKRPEAKQLLYSLESYMAGGKFNPSYVGDKLKIMSLF
jgi:hypothetical protein